MKTRRSTRWRDVRNLSEPFGYSAFRRVWLAQLASELGDWAGRLALSVLVYERTESAVLTALVLSVSVLPYVGIGQLATAVANRLPRRRALVICDIARAGLILLMAVPMPIAAVYPLIAAAAVFTPPFEAVRSALLPNTVPRASYGSAVAVGRVTAELALLVGYSVGGLLVGALGPRPALVINAASFLVSALALRGLSVGGEEERTRHHVRVRDGLAALRSDPFARHFLWFAAAAGSFAVVAESLATVYAAEELHRGAGTVGVLAAAGALGVIIGTVVLPRSGSDARLVSAGTGLATLAAAASCVLFAIGPLWPAAALAFVAAGGIYAGRVPANQVVGLRIPDELRAGVFSIVTGALAVGHAVVPLLAGLMVDPLGVQTTCAIALGGAFVVSLAAFLAVPRRAPSHAAQPLSARGARG